MMRVSPRGIDLGCRLMFTQDARVSYACRMVGSCSNKDQSSYASVGKTVVSSQMIDRVTPLTHYHDPLCIAWWTGLVDSFSTASKSIVAARSRLMF
jgi:hypothetical protein